jgi:hypothetical protein
MTRRTSRLTNLVVLCAVLIAITALVLFVGNGRPGKTQPRVSEQRHLVNLVAAALSTTKASGSYDMTFADVTTPPASCHGVASAGQCAPPPLSDISGHGTVDTTPYAMVAVSDDGSLGTITLFDNGTDVWELGGGNYGLGPSQSSPGAPLSGFAGSVEGTLGQEPGALAMQGLASAGGYLDLEAQEIQNATPAGTGTVEGVPVTIYKLSVTGVQDPDLSSLTSEEVATMQSADAILRQDGFKGETDWISVDSQGYIREEKSQYALSDGTVVTRDNEFSNFGCAGTVLMPGQAGVSAPAAGCVSPDQLSPNISGAGGATTGTTTGSRSATG